MNTETLIKVVAMLDARIDKLYYKVMPEIFNDQDSLPWEYNKASGGVSALMEFRDELQKAIDAEVAAMDEHEPADYDPIDHDYDADDEYLFKSYDEYERYIEEHIEPVNNSCKEWHDKLEESKGEE